MNTVVKQYETNGNVQNELRIFRENLRKNLKNLISELATQEICQNQIDCKKKDSNFLSTKILFLI